MKKTLTFLMVASLTLSACNSWRDSRANPSNWFGPGTPPPEEVPVDEANALIPKQRTGTGLFSRPEEADTSVLLARIDELRIDPTPSGAIVYASGTAIRR